MRPWLALLLLPLGACGDPAGTASQAEGTCESRPEALEWDEVSALGVSPSAALAPFQRTIACSWIWSDPQALGVMHPGPGDSTAEISINYYGAGIDYARGERVGADPYTAYACDSSVVIHAEISVRTATGAIDGSFAVPIEFRTGTNGVGLADVQDAAIRDYSLQWADGRSSVRRALKFELQPSGEQAGEFFDIAKGSSEADPQVWFPAATWSCPLIVD